LPALRDRPSDLPLLVEHFLRELTPAASPTPTMSPSAWAALSRSASPGNVRERKHALHHATILARGSEIQLQHVPRGLQLGAAALPEGAAAVFPLLDAGLGQATVALGMRFVAAPGAAGPVPLCAAVAETVRALGGTRTGVELSGPAPGPAAAAIIDPAEL